MFMKCIQFLVYEHTVGDIIAIVAAVGLVLWWLFRGGDI